MIENTAVAMCRNNCQIRAHRFYVIFHIIIIIIRDVCVRKRRNNVGVQDDRLCVMSRVYNNIRSRWGRRRRRYPDRKKKTSKESAARGRTRNAEGGCVLQESRGKYVISVQPQCPCRGTL